MSGSLGSPPATTHPASTPLPGLTGPYICALASTPAAIALPAAWAWARPTVVLELSSPPLLFMHAAATRQDTRATYFMGLRQCSHDSNSNPRQRPGLRRLLPATLASRQQHLW